MVEPDGSVLINVDNDNLCVLLKKIHPSSTDDFEYLWMYVADHNYGAVLYPSKNNLIELRDRLSTVIDSLPDGIGENAEDEDDDG